MRNKYKYNELVKVNGIGKIYGKVKNELGFIIEKDNYFNDYYIDLIFGKKDWFAEESIERVLENKSNKVDKYQVSLCTTMQGYELIQNNLKMNEPISNDKTRQINIYEQFEVDDKQYIAIGWSSVFWPVSNKSVKIIENTIKEFRKLDIPFQYIVMNEYDLTDFVICESTDNDSNVRAFSIERRIVMKKLETKPPFMW